MASTQIPIASDGSTSYSGIDGSKQFIRKINLVVSGTDLNGLDLSQMRIKFAVKTTNNQTPNTADIRVYNLSDEIALQIKKEFKQVILQAGYEANYGVIFQGNIKQVIIGRESATDTFIDIVAGDGDKAYNFSVVNTTIAAGSRIENQIEAVVKAMEVNGVSQGYIGDFETEQLPRAKAFFGSAKKYMREIGNTTNKQSSIQDEKLTFISTKSFAPGEIININNETGQIGTPQQTNDGVNVKCLLNPFIQIGGRVQLNNKAIQQAKINLEQISAASAAAAKGDTSAINNAIPRPLPSNGVYQVYIIEHTGDTRGIEWYTSIVGIDMDVSANPRNSVQTGFG